MRPFKISSLQNYDGEYEKEIYIVNQGIVYDVTDCPKWRTGLHEGLHFGGQDLSKELIKAPHKNEVFNHPCAKIVGFIKD